MLQAQNWDYHIQHIIQKKKHTYIQLSKNASNFDREEYKKRYKIFESLKINKKEIKNISLILQLKLHIIRLEGWD